jgi:hypothetical protein
VFDYVPKALRKSAVLSDGAGLSEMKAMQQEYSEAYDDCDISFSFTGDSVLDDFQGINSQVYNEYGTELNISDSRRVSFFVQYSYTDENGDAQTAMYETEFVTVKSGFRWYVLPLS